MAGEMGEAVLAVRDLAIEVATPQGAARAVDGVSFALRPGSVLALVGESGSGKSLTALALVRLLPPEARIVSGAILYRGLELSALGRAEMRGIRGKEIGIVFQEPMTSLNPVMRAGDQVAEAAAAHSSLSAREAGRRAVELLRAVGIANAERVARAYPHELSGGLRQRVLIAIAIAADPSVLIADEPTTALDVTVQARILDLIARLTRERNLAVLLITHSFGVVAELADEVAVLYAGRIVERAPVHELWSEPLHPYTRGLFRSIPKIAARKVGPRERRRLEAIPGTVPPPHARPSGCAFRVRCPLADRRCEEASPPLEPPWAGAGPRSDARAPGARLVACFRTGEVAA